jgi:hypothetical protein
VKELVLKPRHGVLHGAAPPSLDAGSRFFQIKILFKFGFLFIFKKIFRF